MENLTVQEQAVLDALVSAWDLFVELPEEHADDQQDFRYHIHRLQDMIAARPVFRSMDEKKEAE